MLMLLIVIDAVPLFVTVTIWAVLTVLTNWFPKESDVEETVAFGDTDVPLKVRTGEFAGAAVLMVSVALIEPLVGTQVGANVTLTVQDEPAASVPTQAFVWPNCVAFVPPIVMLSIVTTAELLFVSVTVWALLIVLTS